MSHNRAPLTILLLGIFSTLGLAHTFPKECRYADASNEFIVDDFVPTSVGTARATFRRPGVSITLLCGLTGNDNIEVACAGNYDLPTERIFVSFRLFRQSKDWARRKLATLYVRGKISHSDSIFNDVIPMACD